MFYALVPLLIVLPLIVFWGWMLNDMVHNPAIPESTTEPFRWPPQAKNYWFMIFIILNVFGAGFYYFSIYRQK
jgi:hypothetical protein